MWRIESNPTLKVTNENKHQYTGSLDPETSNQEIGYQE